MMNNETKAATVHAGDCRHWLRSIAPGTVNACVTSPPYFGLRDYGGESEIGLEDTWENYVSSLVDVFSIVRRALRDDGVLMLNLGDSFYNNRTHNNGAMIGQSVHSGSHNGKPDGSKRCGRRAVKQPGLKDKDLIGVPWRVAFALQADGWWLRQEIRWVKPNPMPDKFRDRCLEACESVFLLSKSSSYHFDSRAIAASNANGEPCPPSNAWAINTRPIRGHHAVMPVDLARRMVLAACPAGGMVIDPFTGSGTTGVAAVSLGRRFAGAEQNHEYASMAVERISGGPMFVGSVCTLET